MVLLLALLKLEIFWNIKIKPVSHHAQKRNVFHHTYNTSNAWLGVEKMSLIRGLG